jgi:hypothetical protein
MINLPYINSEKKRLCIFTLRASDDTLNFGNKDPHNWAKKVPSSKLYNKVRVKFMKNQELLDLEENIFQAFWPLEVTNLMDYANYDTVRFQLQIDRYIELQKKLFSIIENEVTYYLEASDNFLETMMDKLSQKFVD